LFFHIKPALFYAYLLLILPVFGDDNVREIFYPNPDPISWKNKKEIDEQWNNPNPEYN